LQPIQGMEEQGGKVEELLIASLPREMVTNVLFYLCWKDLKNCLLVCEQWHELGLVVAKDHFNMKSEINIKFYRQVIRHALLKAKIARRSITDKQEKKLNSLLLKRVALPYENPSELRQNVWDILKLIAQGANINAQDQQENYTLTFACQNKETSIVGLLLSLGAYYNLKEVPIDIKSSCNNIIDLIYQCSSFDDKIQKKLENYLQSLCDSGVIAPLFLGRVGDDELFLFTSYIVKNSNISESAIQSILKYFYNLGLLDYVNDAGGNILHEAMVFHNVSVTKACLENNWVDVDETDFHGLSVFDCAVLSDNSEFLESCNSLKRFNWKSTHQYENDLLHRAVLHNKVQAAKFLIEKKQFDINRAGGQSQRTPIMYAACRGYEDLFFYLSGKSEIKVHCKDSLEEGVLHMACYSGNIKIIKYLINELKFDIEAKNKHEITPLAICAMNNRVDAMKYLIKHYNANWKVENKFGSDILYLAIINGAFDSVKYLVEILGMKPNNLEHFMAISQNYKPCFADKQLQIAEYFINNCDSDVNYSVKDGSTALYFAVLQSWLGLVKLLVESGADVSLSNEKNKKAVDYATDKAVVEYLKSQENKKIIFTCQHSSKD